ncbi:four helix bundle protein [Fodinibius halophilus]|uniref:Four helix bundle protein n=1 Tax=Fodinibius halophilus TaxID=1736908 RepID=A0A6M1T1C5_9BACT|nr:four helix bundle protein [Fodinibius halophilus]
MKKFCLYFPIKNVTNFLVKISNAAVSITANIAEGYGRFHYQEGVQFYRIARGSLYELKDHLITCMDLGYIDDDLYNQGSILIEEAKKILNGYINFVLKQKNS